MAEKVTIEVDAEVKKALDNLGKINQKLDDISNDTKDVGNSAKKAAEERAAAAKKAADAAAAKEKKLAQSKKVIYDQGSGGGGGGGTWHQQTKAKEKAGKQVAGPGFGKGAYFKDGGLINFFKNGGFLG